MKLTCGLRPEAVTLRFLNILSTVVGGAKIQVSHFNYPPFFVFQNFGLYMSSVRIQIGLSIQASVHQGWLDITAICAMLRFPFLRHAYKERNRRTAAGPWLFLIILALAVCAVVCRVFPRALLPCWMIAYLAGPASLVSLRGFFRLQTLGISFHCCVSIAPFQAFRETRRGAVAVADDACIFIAIDLLGRRY